MPDEKKIEADNQGGFAAQGRGRLWGYVTIPVLLTLLFYWPLLGNDFVSWDDSKSILNNIHLRSLGLGSIQWMFSNFYESNYIPLTWASLALDFKLGGLNPQIYHFHNLVLHLLNTVLVFFLSLRILRLFEKNKGPGKENRSSAWIMPAAFLAALLFGIHPVHVESVAWATERKDLLSGLFFLAGLWVYLNYASRSASKTRNYWICLFLFLLALFSKPMAISFPLVLLLLDGWPLGRFFTDRAKVLTEKIPFFILAFLSGYLTMMAQKQALVSEQSIPFVPRVLNAVHSLFFYLWKMFLPVNLAAYYPFVLKGEKLSGSYLGLALLVLLAAIALYFLLPKRPFLTAGLLYYFITLVPVLGIVQVGSQAAADRYTYLPSLGPFLLAASLAAYWLLNRRMVFILLTAVLAVLLGYGTSQQTRTWKDSVALWENAVRVSPGVSVLAYTNLGNAYQETGRLDDAIQAYDQAIAIDPLQSVPQDWKGSALYSKGLFEEAVKQFLLAIELDPKNALPHINLSIANLKLGKNEEALAEAQVAVNLSPGLARVYNNLGACYWYMKQLEKSVEAYQKAVSLEPGKPEYSVNLAEMYSQMGRMNEAIELCRNAIAINPNDASFYLNLAYYYFLTGAYPKAIEVLLKAAALQPQNPEILQKLGLIYEKTGQRDLAEQYFGKAKALQSESQH